MSFDFGNLKPWEVSTTTLLPVGNHAVTIDKVTSQKNGNNNNELVVEASNGNGSRKDWIVYVEENGARKVVALALAAGVRLPDDADQDESGMLTQRYADLFAGKRAGMVVRDETYNGKTNPRVKGWVDAAQVDADLPADTAGLPQAGANSQVPDDDDIPF